jgi:hypothetical protein
MGNAVLAGRDITWADIYNKVPVAVITETLAREYWKDPAMAVGRRIRETPKNPWREIMGVVGKEHDDGVNRKATPTVYWPMLMGNFWEEQLFAQRSMAMPSRSRKLGTQLFQGDSAGRLVGQLEPRLPTFAPQRNPRGFHEADVRYSGHTGIAAG